MPYAGHVCERDLVWDCSIFPPRGLMEGRWNPEEIDVVLLEFQVWKSYMWPFSQISRIACERPLVIDREGFMMVPHTHKEFIFNHPSIIRNINTISRYCYLSTDFVATNDSILFCFFWGGRGASKITADGDCSHEIKRHLLLGRKAMTNLESILKSRDTTLPTKSV